MHNSSILENESKSENENYDRTIQHDWILPVTINIVLFCATSLLLISIIHYGIKTKKWCQIQKNDSDKLNAGLVYTTLLLCAVVCLLQYVASLAYLNLGFNTGEEELCDSVSDIEHFFYFLVLFLVELFLWFRQRAFYANRMFQVHFSKTIRYISFFSVFVVSTFSLLVLIFETLPNDHSATKGCKFEPNDRFLTTYVILSICMIVVGQSVLIGLLFHALRQTSKPNKKNAMLQKYFACCLSLSTNADISRSEATATPADSEVLSSATSPVSVKRSRSFRSSSIKIKKIMKQTLILAIISVTADILVAIMTFCITNPVEHRELVIAMEDINAFFNLLIILFSFLQWKNIVASPYISNKKYNARQSTQSFFVSRSILNITEKQDAFAVT